MNTGNKSYFAIAVFVALWAIALVGMFILPFESIFGFDTEAILLIMVFVSILAGTAMLWQNTPVFRISSQRKQLCPMSRSKLTFLVHLSLVGTFIGNVLVLIDRIVVRGIDYSAGLRAARYQWLQSEELGGSSISILGNLLIPVSYCGLFLGIFHWESLGYRDRFIALLAGFGGPVCFAMINGGRSNILMALAFAFCVCLLRKYRGKTFFPKIKGKTIFGLIAVFVLFQYLESLFFSFSDNTKSYLESLALGLGVRLDSAYNGSEVENLINLTALYLLHGNYAISAVLSSTPEFFDFTDLNHNVTFRYLLVLILSRIPLIEYQMELPEFDSGMGGFISIPGIFLYDYGILGFLLATFIMGVLFGEAIKVMKARSFDIGIGRLVFCIAVLINIYLSMVTMAMNLGYFWFMVFGMIAMELASRTRYDCSTWLEVK